VTIGADGYNEWRAVARGAVLRFRIPARGRVVITAADTVLHDSLVDGNEAYAPAGSYVFFAGARGDTLRITEDASAISRLVQDSASNIISRTSCAHRHAWAIRGIGALRCSFTQLHSGSEVTPGLAIGETNAARQGYFNRRALRPAQSSLDT
jgi:hypothetical protein